MANPSPSLSPVEWAVIEKRAEKTVLLGKVYDRALLDLRARLSALEEAAKPQKGDHEIPGYGIVRTNPGDTAGAATVQIGAAGARFSASQGEAQGKPLGDDEACPECTYHGSEHDYGPPPAHEMEDWCGYVRRGKPEASHQGSPTEPGDSEGDVSDVSGSVGPVGRHPEVLVVLDHRGNPRSARLCTGSPEFIIEREAEADPNYAPHTVERYFSASVVDSLRSALSEAQEQSREMSAGLRRSLGRERSCYTALAKAADFLDAVRRRKIVSTTEAGALADECRNAIIDAEGAPSEPVAVPQRLHRNETTEEQKATWAAIDRAADRAPSRAQEPELDQLLDDFALAVSVANARDYDGKFSLETRLANLGGARADVVRYVRSIEDELRGTSQSLTELGIEHQQAQRAVPQVAEMAERERLAKTLEGYGGTMRGDATRGNVTFPPALARQMGDLLDQAARLLRTPSPAAQPESQPVQREPVAWGVRRDGRWVAVRTNAPESWEEWPNSEVVPLYASPPAPAGDVERVAKWLYYFPAAAPSEPTWDRVSDGCRSVFRKDAARLLSECGLSPSADVERRAAEMHELCSAPPTDPHDMIDSPSADGGRRFEGAVTGIRDAVDDGKSLIQIVVPTPPGIRMGAAVSLLLPASAPQVTK